MAIDSGSAAVSKGIRIGHLAAGPSFRPVQHRDRRGRTGLRRRFTGCRTNSAKSNTRWRHVTGEELDTSAATNISTCSTNSRLAGGYAWRHRLEADARSASVWTCRQLGAERRHPLRRPAVPAGAGQAPHRPKRSAPARRADQSPRSHRHRLARGISRRFQRRGPDHQPRSLSPGPTGQSNRLADRGAKLRAYPGNYSAFVTQRELQELTQKRAYEEQQADIEKQAEFIRRFGAGQRAREAKGREKRLNRLLRSDALLQDVSANEKDSRLARHRSARRRPRAQGQGTFQILRRQAALERHRSGNSPRPSASESSAPTAPEKPRCSKSCSAAAMPTPATFAGERTSTSAITISASAISIPKAPLPRKSAATAKFPRAISVRSWP